MKSGEAKAKKEKEAKGRFLKLLTSQRLECPHRTMKRLQKKRRRMLLMPPRVRRKRSGKRSSRRYFERCLKVTEDTMTEAPPKDVYTIRTPSIAYPVDVDIIKLTAQFVARNGRQFL
eukprot:336068-Amorphochlora_amoeboformis.AAC.2